MLKLPPAVQELLAYSKVVEILGVGLPGVAPPAKIAVGAVPAPHPIHVAVGKAVPLVHEDPL